MDILSVTQLDALSALIWLSPDSSSGKDFSERCFPLIGLNCLLYTHGRSQTSEESVPYTQESSYITDSVLNQPQATRQQLEQELKYGSGVRELCAVEGKAAGTKTWEQQVDTTLRALWDGVGRSGHSRCHFHQERPQSLLLIDEWQPTWELLFVLSTTRDYALSCHSHIRKRQNPSSHTTFPFGIKFLQMPV